MVNKLMSNLKKELLEEIANTEEVIEFKKIEQLILNDTRLKERFLSLSEVEKQAINARELGLDNAYFMYKKQYDALLKELEDDVVFNQYLSLKEDVKEVMKLVISTIENEINKIINE